MSEEDRERALVPHGREQASEPAPAAEPASNPGKRTRTMDLPLRPAGAPRPVQQKPEPAALAARSERAALTLQWLATATRPDLHPPPVQRKSMPGAPEQVSGVATGSSGQPMAPAGTATAAVQQPAPAITIDPPRPGIDRAGFIDNDDGANLRTGPAELHGATLTARPLPPTTRVFVSGQHPAAPAWWYVSAFLPGSIVRGYVQNFRVNTDLPEPGARLYQIQPGDTVERLAVQEFSTAVRAGHDLRYYENVLLAVNRDRNRAGIRGSFQDPGLFGGGADNIQLEAGRRIWLVSPAYARALEGSIPDGSLTHGRYGKARRALGHIEDLVRSVTDSPRHFGVVAGEYAQAIKAHLPEIIGITAGFIVAESASAFLAATPTGVGQLTAALIQLALAAFGATLAVEACGQAVPHGARWLTLAWTAHGDPARLAAASQAFLKMLVSIAMAALTLAGVHGNLGKGLKIADAIHIQPPTLGWAPAMATGNGQLVAGGPVLTPGSITTTGPVELGISATTGSGAGGSRIQPGESSTGKAGATEKRDVARPGSEARAVDTVTAAPEAVKGQVHHIASDKAIQSGFTKKFERIFHKAGMTLQDPANKMILPGHAGRHAESYHRYVLRQLTAATDGLSGPAYRQALETRLNALRQELLRNPDLVRGGGL